ncbi:dephospho-CoA kinase [Candidatus Woesearchaeota archaeon]|nr:dephospho-CoA kinase [Candidatus Woesearchaeota archaeon]
MLVGIVGTIGAGKGTVTDYLRDMGFQILSLSDLIREEADKKGLDHDRRSMQKLGNELRKEHGPEVLMKLALQRVQGDCVIESIRNPHEASLLRQQANALLVGVDADPKKRFDRVIAREKSTGRSADAKSFEDFMELEARERTEDVYSQQLHTVLDMVDLMLMNDVDSKELFHKDIEKKLSPHLA